MEPHVTTERSCKDSVMHRIEGEGILPRPKSYFTMHEATVWGLWGFSIIIGALAVAVMLFAFMHHQFAFYEATHESFVTFLVDALPYLWISAFGLMAVVAVYNLRHTKHGYRYPVWQIVVSSLVLSVAGGTALHVLGFGYVVDHALGQGLSQYPSQERLESRLWQNPDQGRLLGRVTTQMQPPSLLTTFTDVNGLKWMLDTSELSEEEQELLFSQKNVKLVGLISENDAFLFHTCGAFPWLLDREATREEFQAAREAFEHKMRGYEGRDLLPIFNFREGSTAAAPDSRCGDIIPVRRMGDMHR